MKILHVYKDFYPPVKGGIEYHINLLCTGLKARGVEVEVLISNTCHRFQEHRHDSIHIVKVPQIGRFYSAPLTPTFGRYLSHFGKTADIIHFHHPNPTAELSYLFTKLNKKLVVTYHSDIIRQDKLGKIYAPFRKIFLEAASRIIVTSPDYMRTSSVLKAFKPKCSMIPLGVDIRRFCTDGDRRKIETIKKEHGKQPIILFVGRFRYYKGLEFLIQSMKTVNARLLLIGSGPEEKMLRALVDDLRLNEKIFFIGEIPDDDVNAYYKACDLFVLPSHMRSEAFGIVQLEAMCCGKPVISTNLGTGTSFVNIDQETGITVAPNDVVALTQAINFIIENPEKGRSFGRNGYERVNGLFTAEKMVDRTLQLYEEIVRDKVKAAAPKINPRIKILRIVTRMNIGGATIHVKNLTENMDADRFKTRLVTGTVSAGEGDMGYIAKFADEVKVVIPELQREISPYRDLKALLKVIREINRFKPDIIDSHTSKAGAIVRIAAFVCNRFRKQKIVTVHTFHGNILYGYFGRTKTFLFLMAERFLAKLTDRIVAISQTQAWELVHKYRIDRSEKVTTIKLGFDLKPFLAADQHMGILRGRLQIDEETVLIGIVGRMVPIKNHKMFLDAGKRLIENLNAKKIKLILVGDGAERQFLEKYATDIGIDNHVFFYGWEKNIPVVYADLDILALTSINEGTPVSVIEAMAASVPVVTTGVGGIKDLLGAMVEKNVHDRGFHICERGILCPKENPEIFSDALEFAIRSHFLDDKGRIKKAREYVVKNYSAERLIRDIELLCLSLMAPERGLGRIDRIAEKDRPGVGQ